MTQAPPARLRIRARGVVQGVGFRPFVHQLATRLGLAGHVGNDSAGVFVEIEGRPADLDAFLSTLRERPPPLARIEALETAALDPRGESGFRIVESAALPGARTLVSPDIALCDDCLSELRDPGDRRFRHPFINCVNCGPRFTIVRALPYDRPLTSMADFPLCPECAREYAHPANRRYHAQPVACPSCGPRLWLAGPDGAPTADGDDALRRAQDILRAGGIVAVKGVGGFHLACDATNADAVRTLRARKGRGEKPFAVMAASLDLLRGFARISAAEARLLTGPERPIVLVARAGAGGPCAEVAPGNDTLGLMLPYTALHHLLLEGLPPLVMTSGNLSETPILTANADALRDLGAIADAFLLHDRDIVAPCDDSVARVFEGQELPIRRSRGYAPFPVRLPFAAPPLLATGGELKATLCVAEGAHAFLSQHIGDMERLETLDAFTRAAERLQQLFGITPVGLVGDRHPGYLSRQWAARQAEALGLPLLDVQHHHAHIASVMAEHGCPREARVIGLALDGTGYGDDGAIWGGEVLIAGYGEYRRAAHLRYAPLPGGDAAARRPYRMALAHLREAGVAWADDLPCVAACPEAERRVLTQQLARGVNAPPTSSMGRLFDAVASAIGLRHIATYDAQPAIALEALADLSDGAAYPLDLSGADPIEIDPRPLWRALVADLLAGLAPSRIAGRFHRGVAGAMVEVAGRLRAREGLSTVALSGGVFQNVKLLGLCASALRREGFEVLIHRQVPPNDGGLALGQAAIGAFGLRGLLGYG